MTLEEDSTFNTIPWSLLLNSCVQYSSPACAGLRLSWWQMMGKYGGREGDKQTVNGLGMGEKREMWMGGGEEWGGSYASEGSSFLSGVVRCPCKKEMKMIYKKYEQYDSRSTFMSFSICPGWCRNIMQPSSWACTHPIIRSQIRYVILAAFPHMQAALQPAKLLPRCCL